MPDRARVGRWLVAASAIGYLVFVGLSAAIAPPVEETGDTSPIMHSAQFESIGGDEVTYFDVGRMPNGTVRAAFEDRGVGCTGNLTVECSRTGVRILDPDSRTILWEYSFQAYHQFSTEVHDAEYLPDRNEMLLVDMEAERVFTVDVSTKEITWQWNASSVYEEPGDPRRTDWLHMNDVDRIGRGTYLVSVRNADQVLFVNRSCTCVVEVVNRDSDNRILNKQHNPQWLGDGRMLVADSENDRVVELERQPDGRWKPVWALYSAGGIALDWPRDADRLPNGNTLITDTRNRRIVEVTRHGRVVRSITVPGKKHVYDSDWSGREYPAGESYAGGAVITVSQQPFETVSYLFGGLQYWLTESGWPLPAWVNEWHFLGGILSFAGAALGGVLTTTAKIDGRTEYSDADNVR